jgi:thiol-disulfide isomerase/thioredoxin
MKKILHYFYSLIISTFIGIAPLTCWAKLAVGDKTPTIQGRLLNSNIFSSKTFEGKVILVNFWASWCEPCKEELPLLKSFYEKFHPLGLEIITISVDKPQDIETAKRMIEKYPFINAHKNDLQLEEFGRIWRIPSTYGINRAGIVIRDGLQGEPMVTESYLNQVIRPLIETKN